MDQNIHTSIETLTLPIEGQNKCGQDARYTNEFEKIRQEISKLESPHPSDIQWSIVITHAESLLKTTSKDILVAAQLAVAWHFLEGSTGCLKGFTLLIELFRKFEQNLYPQRLRAKSNALTWFVEQTNQKLEDYTPNEEEKQTFIELKELSQTFSEITRTQLKEHAPAVSPLKTSIERVLQTFPKEEPTQNITQAQSQSESTSSPTQNPSPSSASSIISSEPLSKSQNYLRKTGFQMVETAKGWITEDPTNPKGISLWFTAVYLSMDKLPPHDENGKTNIAPPPETIESQIQSQIENQKWEPALKQCLWAIEKQRLFLDYHFLLHQILENLGPTFKESQKEFELKCAALMLQFPMMCNIQFSNGKPFANPQSVKWFRTLNTASSQTSPQLKPKTSSRSPNPSTAQTNLLNKKLQKALDNFSQKPTENISEIQSSLEQAKDAHARFKLLLSLAEKSLEINQPKFTESLFLELLKLGEAHQLEQWDTELSAHLLSSYHQFLDMLKDLKMELPHSKEEIFQKLCTIHPTAALELISLI